MNRYGDVQHQGTLNKAIRRIIRDCNDEVLLKEEKDPVLLPPFSCHSLRHTFATRLCESGINVKVIQDVLGHADISTTMNIYCDVTNELKRKEFTSLGEFFKEKQILSTTPMVRQSLRQNAAQIQTVIFCAVKTGF